MRTSLAKHVPVAPWDDDGIKRAAKAAWHQRGALFAKADDPGLDPIERGMVEALGTKLYGRREG